MQTDKTRAAFRKHAANAHNTTTEVFPEDANAAVTHEVIDVRSCIITLCKFMLHLSALMNLVITSDEKTLFFRFLEIELSVLKMLHKPFV